MLCHFSHVWLRNTMDQSPPGSSVHGVLEERILQWVTMSSSKGSKTALNFSVKENKRESLIIPLFMLTSPALCLPLWSSGPWQFLRIYSPWIAKYLIFYQMKIRAQFSSVQLLSSVQLFATPWIAARQASLSITNSRSSLRLTSIESVMPSSHLILCRPLLLLPPIPPSIRAFSNELTLHMRGPKYWSFSIKNTRSPKCYTGHQKHIPQCDLKNQSKNTKKNSIPNSGTHKKPSNKGIY